MRTVKWCLMFGVVLAGVVVGFCRPCHEENAPLPPMLTSFDGDCCEEGCDCCKHQVLKPSDTGAGFPGPGYEIGTVLPSSGFGRDDIQQFPKATEFPLAKELKEWEAAEAEKAAKLVR